VIGSGLGLFEAHILRIGQACGHLSVWKRLPVNSLRGIKVTCKNLPPPAVFVDPSKGRLLALLNVPEKCAHEGAGVVQQAKEPGFFTLGRRTHGELRPRWLRG
jgi:hypothetical protein